MRKQISVLMMLVLSGCARAVAEKMAAQSPHFRRRRIHAHKICRLIRLLHDAAEQELANAGRSDDQFIRSHAIEARQDIKDPQAQVWILHGLNDSSEVVRFSAKGWRQGDCNPRRSQAGFAKTLLLEFESERTRGGDFYGLYCLGEKSRAHELETLGFDVDPQVRANTAMAIGLMGNSTGIRVLRAMATDASPMVRIQVAESRWRLGDMDGLTDLISGTISKYPDEQIICLLALAGPGDERVVEHVRSGLVSAYPEVSLAAARAMGQLGSDEGYGVAMVGAKSTDPRQRALAALAFGAIGRKDAQPYLAELIKDSDENVHVAAATAILQLK